MKRELTVEGMMCQNCVKHVRKALEGIEGASDVEVSLEEKKATVCVPESVTDEMLKAAVVDAPAVITSTQPSSQHRCSRNTSPAKLMNRKKGESFRCLFFMAILPVGAYGDAPRVNR